MTNKTVGCWVFFPPTSWITKPCMNRTEWKSHIWPCHQSEMCPCSFQLSSTKPTMSFNQEYLISTTAALQVGGALSGISSGTARHSGKCIDGSKMDIQVQKSVSMKLLLYFSLIQPHESVNTCQQYFRSFVKFSCFHYRFLFWAMQGLAHF